MAHGAALASWILGSVGASLGALTGSLLFLPPANFGPSAFECHCKCETPEPSVPLWVWIACLAATVGAWAVGFVCGSCCPRAAVRHRVEAVRGPGRAKGQGVWGVSNSLEY